ncbi:MAG TPA: hypothetical protein ENK19_06705 [Acidobacteria bacterium]|nr:hypothetical protein [Acidobacteriota bacterium]
MRNHALRYGQCAILFAMVLASGCRASRFRTGDLEAMRRAGEMRVAVRPGFLSSPAHRIDDLDQPEMLRQLAARLGLTLRWVQASRNDQLLPWLREGRADLAVLRFSPAALERNGFVPTTAISWVDDLVIVNEASSVIKLGMLRNTNLSVQRSVEEWVVPSPSLLQGLGANLLPIPEDVPLEEVLQRVRGGRYSATVLDSGLVDALGRRGIRVLGPVARRRPLVWALRPRNPRFREAVDEFLFAEKVLGGEAREQACRDLKGIWKTHVLRLVTRNAPTTTTVSLGGLRGFEYDLAVAFARSLGVRLQLVIPPRETDPLELLERGFGDMAALHEPLPLESLGRFLPTGAYRRIDLVCVAGPGVDPPASVEDLAGRVVAGPPGFLSWIRELPLARPIQERPLAAGKDVLSVLALLERGGAELGVADSDTLRLELSDHPGLHRGPILVPGCSLRWAVAPGALALQRRATAFLRQARRSGLIRRLELSELGGKNRWRPPKAPNIPPGALTPFDGLLMQAGRKYRLDWRLLASVMYEESRFDPQAVGPGGSSGLFQLMPFTWQELGVTDPHDPRQAIDAGARYLRRLMDEFSSVDMADRVAMAIAAYNVGPRHVADARRLAREMGLNPDRWTGNVETAMLLLDNPEVARRFPAGVCRCRRAVAYTRRILRRYGAYRELMTPIGAPGL